MNPEENQNPLVTDLKICIEAYAASMKVDNQLLTKLAANQLSSYLSELDIRTKTESVAKMRDGEDHLAEILKLKEEIQQLKAEADYEMPMQGAV